MHAPADLEEMRDGVLRGTHKNSVPEVHHVPRPDSRVGRGPDGLDHAPLDRLAGPEEDSGVHVALDRHGSAALLEAGPDAGDGVGEVDAVVDGDDVRAGGGHALHEPSGAADVEDDDLDLEVGVAVV